MTRVIKSFRQFTTSFSGSVFSCFSFTLLFLLVLIEPRCNYIVCVISLASLLVSWQLMEAKRELSQNALHLVTSSNVCPVKCALVSVRFLLNWFLCHVENERYNSYGVLLGLDWQLFQHRNPVRWFVLVLLLTSIKERSVAHRLRQVVPHSVCRNSLWRRSCTGFHSLTDKWNMKEQS